MRLKSEIWAAALMKRVFADGHYGAIERRGADEAGALFVRARHRDGSESLFGPAPQSFFETERPSDRVFEIREARKAAEIVAGRLASELRFDRDLWIIEIEVERPEDYLDISAKGA